MKTINIEKIIKSFSSNSHITNVSTLGEKPQHRDKKSPNLFHPIYPIPASLWVLTTYGKLSEQRIMSPVKYLVSQLPKSNDILKHKNFGTLFLLFWYTINFMIFFGAVEVNNVKQM